MNQSQRDSARAVAVLGAGNGGLAAAAHLTSLGCSVRLFDLPEFGNHLPGVRESGIRIFGAVPEATYRPDLVTTDMAEAVEDVRLILLIVPAYGHGRFIAQLLPHLRDDHVVLLCPGAIGGALHLHQELRAARRGCRCIVGEAANLVYAAKRMQSAAPRTEGAAGDPGQPISVRINGIKQVVPAAAMPAADTEGMLAALAPVLPHFTAARDVLDTGLNNINVVVHPVLMLTNLSRVEAAEEWFIFRNGFTPGVARLIGALDRERLALLNVLDLPQASVAQWMARFYPEQMKGADLYEMLSSTPVFSRSAGPQSLRDRYLDEDVPYGLVPMASIARHLRLPAPCTDAVIALASAAGGRDFAQTGWTAERLGLAALSSRDIIAKLKDDRVSGGSG